MAAKSSKVSGDAVAIKAPNFRRAVFRIVGTVPYCQAKFSAKAKAQIRDKMLAGGQSRKGKARTPRDFVQDYKGAMHVSEEGWVGIPASCFRQACISACRLVGFRMTLAKLAIFVEHDGLDAESRTPLVRIHGEPEMDIQPVRNATGVVDLRARPLWREWHADVLIRWDGDLFTATDVLNLMSRVGQQVGIGEGRPDSKQSSGMGWGMFKVEQAETENVES